MDEKYARGLVVVTVLLVIALTLAFALLQAGL